MPEKSKLLDGTLTVSKSLDPDDLLGVFSSLPRPEQASA